MTQKEQNKASMKGEAKGHGKKPAESAHNIEFAGSSGSHGIRFPLHDHHGMGERDTGPKTP